ncbi:MAG: glutathione S-transferase, partial [Planktomarina sp.]|nr:glutathione S-transferase [Planktomarina sp.]
IVPFIRQFANSDRGWFDAQPWPNVQRWLSRFLASDRFVSIMTKYPKWQAGDWPVFFPNAA